ncbi:MAG: NAD(P)H-dependent oxidoreductase [Sphaerochaeta sp.]|uniref:NAD(P)H-dependent oxidoreductase n=1 Tax=Sphaerochaeta sp. TaxID=1972642 RepID=UPI003D09F83A
MNYDLLFPKSEQPLELAIIGVGGFNHSLFTYGVRNKKLSIRVLCGRNIQRCIDAYRSVGVDSRDIIHCTDKQTGLEAFAAGKSLIFDDIDLAMEMPFDVVVEGTGNPEASASYALCAIQHRKHVIAVTKESDSVVGPLLSKKARENGVIYSLAEGDQPSLLIGLVTWVRNAGLTILGIGKASEYDFIYDSAESSIEVLGRKEHIPHFAEVWDLGDDYEKTVQKRSEMLDMFGQRAIPDLAEMSIVCNHLPEFDPDIEAFHYPIARTLEVADLMCPKDRGGLFSGKCKIDVFNCLRRTDEQSMEGGEFVVVACDDEQTWQVLKGKGVPVSRNGKTAMIYYPAHYLGFEALYSVFSVGMLGLPTGAEAPTPRYDLVARANRDMQRGTQLKAVGHHHVIEGFDGILRPAARIDAQGQLPYYLADGMTLKKDVKAGELLTADMLEKPVKDSILWSLRREQDTAFLSPKP